MYMYVLDCIISCAWFSCIIYRMLRRLYRRVFLFWDVEHLFSVMYSLPDLGPVYIYTIFSLSYSTMLLFHCVVVSYISYLLYGSPPGTSLIYVVHPLDISADIHTLFDYIPLELLHHVTVRQTCGQWLVFGKFNFSRIHVQWATGIWILGTLH